MASSTALAAVCVVLLCGHVSRGQSVLYNQLPPFSFLGQMFSSQQQQQLYNGGGRTGPRNMLLNPLSMYSTRMMSTDPFALYHQRQNRQEIIMKQARTQSAVMAEQYLSNMKENEGCFHRSYCTAPIEKNPHTAKAAEEAIRVMDTMLVMVREDQAQLPHVQQLVAAYNVGKMTENPKLCRWLFPCSQEDHEARTTTAANKEPRFVTCKQTSKLCPGVSLSCGLCAIISPESCSVVCPVGAIYCGTAGYACAIEAAQEAAAAAAAEAEAQEEGAAAAADDGDAVEEPEEEEGEEEEAAEEEPLPREAPVIKEEPEQKPKDTTQTNQY